MVEEERRSAYCRLRNRQGYTKAAPSATGEDYDEAFLKEQAAEIESYVAACKEVDAAKVERRAEVEREARRPFRPPQVYQVDTE